MFKTVLKSNFKRYWWVFGLNIALIFVGLMLPVITDNYSGHYYFSYGLPVTFAIAFGAVNAWSVFGYMNSSRAVNLYHSLPSTKTAIFGANVLYGLTSEILPILFSLLLIPLVNGHGYEYIDDRLTVGYILFPALSVGLAIFAASCFTVMFSGSSVAGKVFTPIIVFLPLLGEEFIAYMKDERLFGGYYGTPVMSEKLYGMPYDDKLTVSFWIQLASAAILLILAYIAYRRRKMENAGEVVTVKWAKVLFVQGAALCFGEFISYAVWNRFTYLGTILIGLVAAAAAMMILQKTYRIKGFVKQAVGFLCIVGAIALVYEGDITGFEKRIPDPADVKSVSFSTEYGYADGLTSSDPALIEKIITAHRAIVKDRPEEIFSCRIYLEYKLKNGRTLVRVYHLSADDRDKYVKELLDSREYRQSLYEMDHEWKTVTISVFLPGNYKVDGVDYNLTPAEIKEVREALAADLETVSYEDIYYYTYDSDRQDINLSMDELREKSFEGESWVYRPILSVGPNMPRAYAVLERIQAEVRAEYTETDVSTGVFETNVSEAEAALPQAAVEQIR